MKQGAIKEAGFIDFIRLFASTMVFLLFGICSQAQSLEWANSIGGVDYDQAYALTLDSLDNIYITGFITDSCEFDPNSNDSLYIGEAADVFVAKYDNEGQLIWVKQINGAGNQYGNCIAVSDSGHIYVAGRTSSSTLDFDPGEDEYLLTLSSGSYAFSLNENGEFRWAHVWPNIQEFRSIAVDASEQVYLGGNFLDVADFDPDPNSNYILDPGGSNDSDGFLLKLNSNAEFLWAKLIDGPGSSYVNSLIIDGNNDILFGGYYSGTADFDLDAPLHEVPSLGSLDCYVEKVDSSGGFIWVRTFGGSAIERVNSLALTSGNGIIASGEFRQEITIVLITGDTIEWLAPDNNYDAMQMKLNANGEVEWANAWGGFETDIWTRVTVNAQDEVFTTGLFLDTMEFTYDTIPYVVNNANNNYYGYLTKHTANGEFVWARALEGSANVYPHGITMNSEGAILLIGNMQDTVQVDFSPSPNDPFVSLGEYDMFLAKYSDCALISNTVDLVACDIFQSPLGQYWVESGVYPEILLTENGCDSLLITNFEMVGIDTTLTNSGNSLQATTLAEGYQWLDCDNFLTPISGADSASYFPISSGSFAVVLTNGPCVDTSGCAYVQIITTEELSLGPEKFGFEVYPNPSSKSAFIRTNTDFEQLRIIDQLGNVVHQINAPKHLITIDIEAQGFYTIIGLVKGNVITKKLLIMPEGGIQFVK